MSQLKDILKNILTSRQYNIYLFVIEKGFSEQETANILNISQQTVSLVLQKIANLIKNKLDIRRK